MNLKLLRLHLFYGLTVLCIITTIRCQSSAKVQRTETKKTYLATRVEHFYLVSDQSQKLFIFFRDNFQLPEVWPFYQHETFASGGLSLGNVVLEFVSLPKEDPNPYKTEFRGVALEPTMDAIATSAELSKRNLSHTEIWSYKSLVPGSQVVAEWSSIGLSKFPPENADIFFCDYKDRERVEKGRNEARSELARQGGGPLGIIDAAEIIVGVKDIKEARRKWSALLSPSPRISNDAFFFNTGPAIRLVQTKSPGIKGINLRVNSLDYAVKFLDEHGWLSKDKNGQITVSPDVIEGLSIILVEASVGDKENSFILGSGRGVDHMGILVKDLENTCRDYEQILGFKCIKNPTGSYSGSLRSLIIFGDETLLEFLSPPKTDSVMSSEYLSYMRDFISKHEGAMSLALEASSAKDAAEFLRERDFEVRLTEWPKDTEENVPRKTPVQYTSVSISDAPSVNKKAFKLWIWFVEYAQDRSERLAVRREQGMMDHPNTAQRLHSVWFAVKDMEVVLRNLQDAGFETGKPCKMKLLGAGGREIPAGKGRLLILQSTKKDGALKEFLSSHEDGDIIGISIRVTDLNKARSWIEANSGNKFESYDGLYGQSILIPPELTHGVWMELFQQ